MNAGDGGNVLLVERMEDHDFVNAVDELGPKMRLHLAHHGQLDHLIVVARHLLDHLAAQIRSHDDHRILEVHRAPLAVGHATVVEHLQQYVEHVRMGLLDFVEQDHAVRLAANQFGQVAPLLVADVTWRRTDQPGHGMLLHELAHVDANQVVFGVEQEFGQRLAQFCLAHPRRAEEQEGTVGPALLRQPGARAANGVGNQTYGFVLADHALVQLILHLQQLFALALHHFRHRNARGTRHHFGNFLGADLGTQEPVRQLAVAELFGRLQLRLKLRQLAVLKFSNLIQLALALKVRHQRTHLVDFLLDVR